MRIIISSIALASTLLLSSCYITSTQAWVSSPSASSSMTRRAAPLLFQEPRSTTALASTLEAAPAADSAISAAAAPVELTPAFAAATKFATAKLEASIPAKYATSMLPLLIHFLTEYMTAHQAAALTKKDDTTNMDPAQVAARFLTGVGYGVKFGMPDSPDHYTFDVSHTALRGTEPDNDTDYYRFGCDFFHDCMDLTSPQVNVLGLDNLQHAMDQLAAGENVIFFANHQSEADPQVVSSCLELAGYGEQAAELIYVAGHKVTTDPLAIPFSMGRNLICIHSKKHIDADPDTKPMKQRQNLKAMNSLLSSLKAGGTGIWVAPSGGRDRRDVATGHVPVAPFDSKTMDMFRLMGNKSKIPTHYYTFGMVSYDLCPPPDFVEAGVGESRNVRFSPVGIHVGAELESVGGLEKRQEFNTHAMEQCVADYETLRQTLEAAAAAK